MPYFGHPTIHDADVLGLVAYSSDLTIQDAGDLGLVPYIGHPTVHDAKVLGLVPYTSHLTIQDAEDLCLVPYTGQDAEAGETQILQHLTPQVETLCQKAK